jgi:hypothetical protein
MKDFFNEKYAVKKRGFSFNSSLKTLKKKFHFELKENFYIQQNKSSQKKID